MKIAKVYYNILKISNAEYEKKVYHPVLHILYN